MHRLLPRQSYHHNHKLWNEVHGRVVVFEGLACAICLRQTRTSTEIRIDDVRTGNRRTTSAAKLGPDKKTAFLAISFPNTSCAMSLGKSPDEISMPLETKMTRWSKRSHGFNWSKIDRICCVGIATMMTVHDCNKDSFSSCVAASRVHKSIVGMYLRLRWRVLMDWTSFGSLAHIVTAVPKSCFRHFSGSHLPNDLPDKFQNSQHRGPRPDQKNLIDYSQEEKWTILGSAHETYSTTRQARPCNRGRYENKLLYNLRLFAIESKLLSLPRHSFWKHGQFQPELNPQWDHRVHFANSTFLQRIKLQGILWCMTSIRGVPK